MVGMFLLFIYICIAATLSLIFLVALIVTGRWMHLKIIAALWLPLALFTLFVAYHYYPIDKGRVVGVYRIDADFYPGENADWQKELFSFEITENDEFIFREKLKDGSFKETMGKVVWLRQSSPMLFSIMIDTKHPLIDENPTLYRGNRKFYYVFDSKFGNMFYRKER